MGIDCDRILNNKFSYKEIEMFLQNTISEKDNIIVDKSISIQYKLLEEYNHLKKKSNYNKEIFQSLKNGRRIISGFIPLSQEKELFTKWIKIIFNLENIKDFQKKKSQNIPNDNIFQNNLENRFINDKKLFLKLVSKGLPHHLRQFIWTIIIDKDQRDILNVSNYERETIHFKTLLSLKKNTPDIEQIEKDIYRTFFLEEDKTEKKIFLLKELLIALNNLNENIGYCQGINFIVAFILKVTEFNKIKAFHLSRLILKKIKGYFQKDFPLLKYNLKKFNKGFSILFPKLFSHFKKNEVVDELWIGKWIQTLFTVNLPFKESCYIWDSLLVYGVDFIIPISLSILYFTEKELLQLKDSSDIINFLQETFNPNKKHIINRLYNEKLNLYKFIIPVHDIISYAKKIRNRLNFGPRDGNEYTFRNLIDSRRSYNKKLSNSSVFNYEKKMERISQQKAEEKSLGLDSVKTVESTTDDFSSINKSKTHEFININNRRINKFYTIHHKNNKKEEKKIYDIKDNKLKNSLNFNHNIDSNNNNKVHFNNSKIKNSKIIFPFYELNNNNNNNISTNQIKTNLFQNFKDNSNKGNKAFSENKNNSLNYYNNISDGKGFNLNNEENRNRNSFVYNNYYQQINNLNCLYKHNLRKTNVLLNFSPIVVNSNNQIYNTYQNNNYSFYNNAKTLNTEFNYNPYLPLNYNKEKERRSIYTPEIDKYRLKEKINNTIINNHNNYIDNEFLSKGVNEFFDGEKYRNEIPQFNNIKIISGY